MLDPNLYSGAVIRLATLQKERKQAAHLLFATVSLLSRGRPLPPPMDGLHQYSIGKTGQTVFFRYVVTNVQDAINWYRSLGHDQSDRTPLPSRAEERDTKYDGVEIEISRLTDDPIWPSLGLPIEDGLFSHPTNRNHPAPFIGRTLARIHRRFGRQDGFDVMLNDDNAIAFIARRLHVDLRHYQEYLGSVVLIAPDPVIKQIDCFMVPASLDRGERILYRFVPRPGESLNDLQLTTFDEQSNLLTDFVTQEIPANGVLDIEKGDCVGTYGYVLTHRKHGVLLHNPPTPFLRQMSFSLQFGGSEKKTVSVPTGESAKSPRMEYQASQSIKPDRPNVIGDGPRIPNVNVRIAAAKNQRSKVESAKQYGQRWFPDGSREDAMRFIQNELRRAKTRVLIADPYFGALQLGQYLYAINPESVEVILLSSSLAFKANGEKCAKIIDFSQGLIELKDHAKLVAKAYVLKSPILHDRFLVVDDEVWFLGNSLNTLGDKTSLIVKLPNPYEVIELLGGMLRQAVSFDQYQEEHMVSGAGS